jgi:cold shock CspA family protein
MSQGGLVAIKNFPTLRFAVDPAMNIGVVSQLAATHGSTWGRIRLEGQNRDVFFNLQSLIEPDDFALLAVGQHVRFEQAVDRANGMRAVRMEIVELPQPATTAAGRESAPS